MHPLPNVTYTLQQHRWDHLPPSFLGANGPYIRNNRLKKLLSSFIFHSRTFYEKVAKPCSHMWPGRSSLSTVFFSIYFSLPFQDSWSWDKRANISGLLPIDKSNKSSSIRSSLSPTNCFFSPLLSSAGKSRSTRLESLSLSLSLKLEKCVNVVLSLKGIKLCVGGKGKRWNSSKTQHNLYDLTT